MYKLFYLCWGEESICIYILDIEPLDSIRLIFYESVFKSPHQTLKIYFSFLKYPSISCFLWRRISRPGLANGLGSTIASYSMTYFDLKQLDSSSNYYRLMSWRGPFRNFILGSNGQPLLEVWNSNWNCHDNEIIPYFSAMLPRNYLRKSFGKRKLF